MSDHPPTPNQIRSARGGKRAGSGRKRSGCSKKIRISTSLAVDVVEYLDSRTDKPKAQIIEDALRDHQEAHAISCVVACLE